jgi:tRNA(Arg) A34 adenosine deaminase TadA
MRLAIAEAKRARDRGDYAIGAVITQLIGNREVVIASAAINPPTNHFQPYHHGNLNRYFFSRNLTTSREGIRSRAVSIS